MTIFKVFDIRWDADDEVASLPSEVEITCSGPEAIAEALSREYDWLVIDFKAVPIVPGSPE
ncbi:hypothetical protein [Stenotrophomonas maltophilia]|uniref:hypothetical protein n=1 Tax=Stenotrophomonas maltophilia TaxID=40324 RepID=UPI00066AC21E|nr:hypothetical protein [Stenotrophomonas maltophilia]AWB79007.1 hypothetical protein B7H26_14190 [Stenotrophomonas maltophilia]MBH1566585.1 hypothetical protein [Stenotrophomonas maltophilia]MBH1584980.1 hypothetical protein [Stenotrophomonas maltophilia]MCF3498628.1 hypothetical protein [Stenotrophomonas maltophilia]HEL5580531.1 hypothetical protein [Stenotrophomonas maltophilia]